MLVLHSPQCLECVTGRNYRKKKRYKINPDSMKLNGVLIFRISDFKRYFDFSSFWSEKDEFFRLVKPYDILDDFMAYSFKRDKFKTE